MKIAMLGTRGVPASYSGFETCVEDLGSRLVQRGHEVTVYCRSHHIHYAGPSYRGMRLVKLPTIPNKYLDTIIHTFLSCLHAALQRYDIALIFIAGNSPVAFIPRLAGQKVAINVDGLDWKRQKWPALAKKYIQVAECLATKFANIVITDSRSVQANYRQRFGVETVYIPYGAEICHIPPGSCLHRYELTPRGYFLYVGRLVPENCPHHLVEAFRGLDDAYKCVVVGDAPYANDYISGLKSNAGPNVLFTGYLFGDGYRELASNAYAFVETSEVGGTHPALLEAMAFGNCVIVNDTPENLETIGEAGLSYDGRKGPESLRVVLEQIVNAPELVEKHRGLARARVAACYDWNRVTDDYETLFRKMLRK